MRLPLLILVALPCVSLRADNPPVPVQEEPFHKVVFENDYVRLIDVQIEPGQTSLYHRHVIPSVVVYLTKSTNRSESWPDHAILTRDISPGQSRYAPYDETSLAHRVTNTGSGLFRVFDIELLRKKPTEKTPLPPLPASATLHFDEPLARNSNVQLAPDAITEFRASSAAFLVIGIAGKTGAVRGTGHGGGNAVLRPGDYHFLPARTRLVLANHDQGKAEVVVLEMR